MTQASLWQCVSSLTIPFSGYQQGVREKFRISNSCTGCWLINISSCCMGRCQQLHDYAMQTKAPTEIKSELEARFSPELQKCETNGRAVLGQYDKDKHQAPPGGGVETRVKP